MEVVFLPTANEDFAFLRKSGNITLQNKNHQLQLAIAIRHLKRLVSLKRQSMG